MLFDVMLQSLLNRGAVTDKSAEVGKLLRGAVFDEGENKWEIEIDTLEHLRALAGPQTIALRFGGPHSMDDHLLIILEDQLDG